MLRMEISLIYRHLLVSKLSLTMPERRYSLIMNWARWHIPCIFAFYWISYRHTLVVDIGGVSSAVDGLILLLLDMSLWVMDGMDLYAVYWLRLVWYQSAVVGHE